MMRAFSLLDTKVGAFSAPFFFQHVGQAIRACQELGADLRTTVGRHPADFVLYEVGTFDEDTGAIASVPFVSHGPVVAMLPEVAKGPLFDHAPRVGEGFLNGGSDRQMAAGEG